jgi:hypothetical protein
VRNGFFLYASLRSPLYALLSKAGRGRLIIIHFSLLEIHDYSAKLSEKLCDNQRETETGFSQMMTPDNLVSRFLISTSLRSVSFGMTVIPGGQRSASRGLASLPD